MCVVWQNGRQFNEVILSQMDLFFIIKKKKYMKKSKFFISKTWEALLETNKHLKSREEKKSQMLKGIHLFLFIGFIFFFLWKKKPLSVLVFCNSLLFYLVCICLASDGKWS